MVPQRCQKVKYNLELEENKQFLNNILYICYSVDDEWKGLTNALAGLFCASLNFVNPANSVSPEYTFRPTGVVDRSGGVVDSVNSSHLRYSSLPREIVCTENLTPFKKLLPCDSKVCKE